MFRILSTGWPLGNRCCDKHMLLQHVCVLQSSFLNLTTVKLQKPVFLPQRCRTGNELIPRTRTHSQVKPRSRLPSMQSERTMAEAQHHCQETKQFWELLNGWPNLDAAMYRLWWGLQKLMSCMFSNVADVTTWAIRSLSIKCELWFSTKCLFCNINTPGCQQCKDCPQELRRRSRFWY